MDGDIHGISMGDPKKGWFTCEHPRRDHLPACFYHKRTSSTSNSWGYLEVLESDVKQVPKEGHAFLLLGHVDIPTGILSSGLQVSP